MEYQEEESRSRFLFKNLIRGLIWFAVIITAYILLEDYIQTNFRHTLETMYDRPFILFGIFFTSEVVFGIIPPEFFMMVWILNKVRVYEYIADLTILTIISYVAGVIGYFIGKYFSKTAFYKRIHARHLYQYDIYLKRYGGFLVFVGAVTPLPYSATCMLAGSINLPFNTFLLICISRIVRFAVYGWMVWTFPTWF